MNAKASQPVVGEKSLKSTLLALWSEPRNKMIVCSAGGALVLVVVIILGLLLSSTPTEPFHPPTLRLDHAQISSRPPLLSALKESPLKGIMVAFTHHTVPAVGITLLVLSVIIAIVVILVLQTQKKQQKVVDEEKNEDVLAGFLSRYGVYGAVAVGVVVVVVVGVVLGAKFFKGKPQAGGGGPGPGAPAHQGHAVDVVGLVNNTTDVWAAFKAKNQSLPLTAVDFVSPTSKPGYLTCHLIDKTIGKLYIKRIPNGTLRIYNQMMNRLTNYENVMLIAYKDGDSMDVDAILNGTEMIMYCDISDLPSYCNQNALSLNELQDVNATALQLVTTH